MMWRRVLPALVLVLLAPFIGEFLLGNTPVRLAVAYPVDLLMYGCGALLVREVTRRTGRGWPTMLALGLAYGFVEEGLGDMSLFNPNFYGQHLLNDGNLFGIGWTWWFYVLTLHVVWSIGASVGLTEALFARRGAGPWLGRIGLSVCGVLFVLGVVLVHLFAGGGFHLAAWQVVLSVACVLACVIVAFLLPRRGAAPAVDARPAPRPWRVGVLALGAAVAFQVTNWLLGGGWPIPVDIALYLAVAVPVVRWSRRPGWGPAHRYAPVAAAVLTYCGLGFRLVPKDTLDLAGQVVFALLSAGLVVLAARTVRAADGTAPAERPLAGRVAAR